MSNSINCTGRQVYFFLVLAGFLSVATLVPVSVGRAFAQAVGPSSSLTGNLNTARYNHTATLLPNGQVLVVGGVTVGYTSGPFSILNSAEVYDPATERWRPTGSFTMIRNLMALMVMPNGKVLAVGGTSSNARPIVYSAELYDPATEKWTITGTTTMWGHLTLLPNGKVLAVSGNAAELNAAELYDPVTERWSSAGRLNVIQYAGAATLLSNGKVLVTGGRDDINTALAELYDPATGTWSVTGNPIRYGHSTLLPNDKVLGVSGNDAELYDPATGTWRITGKLNVINTEGTTTTTLLSNGQVLSAGAFNYDEGYITNTELYDPTTGVWRKAGNLVQGRDGHTATLLLNGKVLIAGGRNYDFPTFNSAELFDLNLPQLRTVATVSAASYRLTGLASEAIATSFGSGLATTTLGAITLPLPTQLAGTTVKLKDSTGTERLAPLFFVSPTQVNYQIPPGTLAGAATVTITNASGAVSTGLVLIKAVAPSLFTANGNGQGVAAALVLRVKADGAQSYEPIAQFDPAQNKFVTRPLDLGPAGEQVFLILFGTGIRQRSALSSVIAAIGGMYAEVSFAGSQPDAVGLDQINLLVPRSLVGRGEVDVLLTADAQMANPVRVSIR